MSKVFKCENPFAVFTLTLKHLNTFALVFLLSACTQNQNQIPVVGDLDSSIIAMDTVMQKGFETSYEFHKTLVANEKLVYDVIGYGGTSSQGELAILRRDAENKTDTVIKEKREGIIADAFLADSNRNNKMEVYVIIQNPIHASEKKLLRFEIK